MTILILTSSLGAGHISISETLKEIIERNSKSKVIISDISSKLIRSAYSLVGSRLYSALAKAWEWSDNPETSSFIVKVFDLAEGDKIATLIKKYDPNLIISTENLSSYSVQQYMRTSGSHIPHLVTIADPITIHHYWTAETNADHYIVPLEETKKVLVSRGISSSRITITGYPTRQVFLNGRVSSPEDNTIFLGGSGEGQGGIYEIVKELYKRNNKLNELKLIVVCGKNKELYRKIKSLPRPKNYSLELYKFVKNIEILMSRSQFVIGKPGPNILFESISLGKPFIATGNPLTQELGNYELVDSEGLGSSANNPRFAAEKIINLISNPQQISKYKDNLASLARIQKNSHQQIWNVISKVTKKPAPRN